MGKYSGIRPNVKEVIFELIDGEMVILNLSNGNYYTLDGLGVMIWELILNYGDLEKISGIIYRLYKGKIGIKKVRETVYDFMEELLKHGLILKNVEETLSVEITENLPYIEYSKDTLPPFCKPVLHTYRELQDKYTHPAGIKRSDE